MVRVFEHEPWWPDYKKSGDSEVFFKAMFQGDKKEISGSNPGDVVYGDLINTMSWPNNKEWNPNCSMNLFLQYKWTDQSGFASGYDCPEDAAIATPLKDQMYAIEQDHEAMIVLKGLQYSPAYADLYVDVWWLTRGLNVDDISYLRSIQSSAAEHFCCYLSGGVRAVNPMMNGFARVITYSDTFGIESMEEGDWNAGKQINFGRGAYKPKTLAGDPAVVFKYYVGWYGGGVGIYGYHLPLLNSWF